jgi:hypothetical protein
LPGPTPNRRRSTAVRSVGLGANPPRPPRPVHYRRAPALEPASRLTERASPQKGESGQARTHSAQRVRDQCPRMPGKRARGPSGTHRRAQPNRLRSPGDANRQPPALLLHPPGSRPRTPLPTHASRKRLALPRADRLNCWAVSSLCARWCASSIELGNLRGTN